MAKLEERFFDDTYICVLPVQLKPEFSNSPCTKEPLKDFIVFLPKIILIDLTLITAIYPVHIAVSLLSIRKDKNKNIIRYPLTILYTKPPKHVR